MYTQSYIHVFTYVQNSLNVMKGFVDITVSNSPHLTTFQFERLGYFCVDYDTTPDKVHVCIVKTSIEGHSRSP